MHSRRLQLNIFFALFGIFVIWWLLSAIFFPFNKTMKEWFGISYGAMALFGGIIGLINSRGWGGWANTIGRAIICFSVGLFLQTFGQIAYAYFITVGNIQIPYPSIGDFGFTMSIPFYIYALYLLGKAAISYGMTKSYYRHLGLAFVTMALLPILYIIFLSARGDNTPSFIAAFLNFIVPFGDAFYLSLAFFVYCLSRDSYLGVLRRPLLIVGAALAVQAAADFMFLVQARHGTWATGGVNDFMYFTGYAILTFGIFRLGTVAEDTRAVIGVNCESRRFFNPMRFWKERVAPAVDKSHL